MGGSSGMELALAKRCLDNGAEVIIVGRDKGKLARARENLDAHSRLETIAADITEEEQVLRDGGGLASTPSGAAGLAGLLHVADDPARRFALGLNDASVVLLIASEAANPDD